MVNHNSTADVGVAEGSAVVSGHAGLHALGRFCDVLGLGELLSGAYGPIGEREPVHDRGKVLVQVLLVFAGGGEACSDIEVLRGEGAVFGSVPSASTPRAWWRWARPRRAPGSGCGRRSRRLGGRS